MNDEIKDINLRNINRIDLDEFQEQGFLQEVNRLFFHPRGLALEMVKDEDGKGVLGGIWDYREDDEGIIFADGVINQAKIDRVEAERFDHTTTRCKMFGSDIQQS